jgi:hypothetical protein
MPGLDLSRIGQQARSLFSPDSQYLSPLAVLLISVFCGVFLAGAVLRYEPAQQISIGNTAGSLSVLVELSEARLLVGAGPSRAHAADLIGRTTRPWDRQIDLLVLPGWDDQHVAGAMGLLERRSVSGIAILGLPDEHPTWTLLERDAEQRDVPIVYVDRPATLAIDSSTEIAFSGISGESSGAWVRIQHEGKLIDIVDSDKALTALPVQFAIDAQNNHVVISTRDQMIPATLTPEVAIVPEPFWQSDFTDFQSDYRVTVDRNQHIQLSIQSDEIRIPLEKVTIRPE